MKKLLTIITIMIISLIGITSVNAATVNYTYKKYRIQFYSLSQGTSAWTSVEDFGTRQPFSSSYGVSGVSARFGWSSRFQAGTTYRVTLDWGVAPVSARNNYAEISSYSCYGSTSTNNWSADASLIQTCNLVGTTLVPNGGAIRYIFDITPLQTVIGLQVNAFSGQTEEITGANVYTSSTITYGEDATGAINDQTIIIQDEFDNITNIITENNQNLINAITEENQVCEYYDKNAIELDGKFLVNSGNIDNNSGYGVTKYIKINSTSKITLNNVNNGSYANICYYNVNKDLISCKQYNTLNNGTNELVIPNNTSYVRFSINKGSNIPTAKICSNGNQAIIDADHNYTEEKDQSIINYENTQDAINNQLDLDTTNKINIALDTNTNNFIWTIFDSIKNVNGKIILFFNSLMALGIIKIILGR